MSESEAKPAPETDAEDLFADLSAAHPGRDQYTPLDRYRDFRAVFLGSDQGRRVLYEIMALGHVFRAAAPFARFDAYKTMFFDGERNLALKVFGIAKTEPPAGRPTKTVSTKPKG